MTRKLGLGAAGRLALVIVCTISSIQHAQSRQTDPITFGGAAGARVGRWHGPAEREAPVAIILCERDAPTSAAAIVPSFWTALEEHGIRSLTLDPMPTVPLRQSLVLDVGRVATELARRTDIKPSALGFIGVAGSGAALLVLPKLEPRAAFIATLATDLASVESNREAIDSLAVRGGPPTLLVFAAPLQQPAAISASLETLLKAPVRRPVDVSVLGEGQSAATMARDIAIWVAARAGSRAPIVPALQPNL